jgi:hypothetical protein
MRISRVHLRVLLILCFLVATCISTGPTDGSPVLGADMPLYRSLARVTKIMGKVEIQAVTGADRRVISALLKSGIQCWDGQLSTT